MKQKLDIHQLRKITRSRRKSSPRISRVEESIITVQHYFLTAGLHCITVPNHEHGRSLLRVCLDSLNLYADIGMLSVTTKKTPAHYRNLYDELTSNQALTADDGRLEEYLLSSFSCDFLILEYTQELMEEPWFGKFEHLLHDYSITSSIPVIMFLYDEQALQDN